MNENQDFFTSESELQKALYAGKGAGYESTGGRTLIPENIDPSIVVALQANRDDFKMMNLLKKNPVASPVSEYVREVKAGSGSIFYDEGESVADDTVELERVARTSKYMQTLRKVSMQLQRSNTIEDPVAVEKEAGIYHLLTGIERNLFHGDESINPKSFDSIPKMITKESKKAGFNTTYDMRGKTMIEDGDKAIDAVARLVNEAGGTLTHSMMPPAIAGDLQMCVKDRLLLTPQEKSMAIAPLIYPTMYGDRIIISGSEGGSNKFYRIKGKITPSTAADAPAAPTVAASAAGVATSGSYFTASDAGSYHYQVYAIDAKGRYSQAGNATPATAVVAGDKVTLTISGGDNKAVGYVICRSAKDAADNGNCQEMIRVPKDASGTTVVEDLNEDLPGTGEMLLLSMGNMKQAVRWQQFLPATKVELFPTDSLVTPFIIAMFGTPDVKVPWYNGLIKNIGWSGSTLK